MSKGPNQPLGLIAGQGRLPVLVAQGMRAAGARVSCVGLRDQYDALLPEVCDEFREAGIVQIGRWIRILRRAGVAEAVMVGRIGKGRMHDPLRVLRQIPDWRAAIIWYRRLRHDRRNAAVLAAVADELSRCGITLVDSTAFITDHLTTPGVMGSIEPTSAQRADLAFGWPLLERTIELEIGQSIAVRDRDVLAVEALEGTDGMIDRAGSLCRSAGWTLLKSARPDHDRRADVPTVGIQTIERLRAARGGCLALGAGRVIMIDKPRVIEAANRAGIALVGVE
jgi:DUF1009 family protein